MRSAHDLGNTCLPSIYTEEEEQRRTKEKTRQVYYDIRDVHYFGLHLKSPLSFSFPSSLLI